jgi:hypothetical protein
VSLTLIPFLTTFMVVNVGWWESDLWLLYLSGGVATMLTLPLVGRLADRFGKLLVFRVGPSPPAGSFRGNPGRALADGRPAWRRPGCASPTNPVRASRAAGSGGNHGRCLPTPAHSSFSCLTADNATPGPALDARAPR